MYDTGACGGFGVPVPAKGGVMTAPLLLSQAPNANAATTRMHSFLNIIPPHR
jgi:hypothetical protein